MAITVKLKTWIHLIEVDRTIPQIACALRSENVKLNAHNWKTTETKLDQNKRARN